MHCTARLVKEPLVGPLVGQLQLVAGLLGLLLEGLLLLHVPLLLPAAYVATKTQLSIRQRRATGTECF